MKSTGLGYLMTQLLMLAFGLVLLVPCAYKLTTYILFRYKAVAVDGTVDKPARCRELGSRHKDPELAINVSGGENEYIGSFRFQRGS